MNIKRLASFGSALLLSLSSLMVFQVPKAFALTKTWDGGGVDNNFSTAANWDLDTVPSNGDDLVFPAHNTGTDENLTNDLSGATFNTITFSGAATSGSRYIISGNSMTLVAGITNSMTTTGGFDIGQILATPLTLNTNQTIFSDSEYAYVMLQGVVSGTGNLTKTGSGDLILDAPNTYTGTTTVSAGKVLLFNTAGLGATSAGTTTGTAASVWFMFGNNNVTVSEPFTLSNDFQGSFVTLHMEVGYGPLEGVPDKTITLNGAITLTKSAIVRLGGINANLTNVTLNGNDVILDEFSYGTLTVNGQAEPEPSPQVITLSDNQPAQAETVGNNQKYIINGQRGDVSTYFDGILSGSGTLAITSLRAGATLAPGTSPGCLNTGNLSFTSTSTYEVEIAGTTVCTQYDQTKVTGTVNLGSAALKTVLLNNFKPVVGNTFTVIENDAADTVTGTFNNLAEGATFTVSGYVLKISYVGGDGNDVVLTVQSVPATPNTGFSLLSSNPLLTMLTTLFATAGIVVIARRYSKV